MVSLDKFVDEYSRNVTRIDRGDISNVISRHQQELSEKWAIFKETIINDLTAFEESFQYYFHYIYEQRTLLPKI